MPSIQKLIESKPSIQAPQESQPSAHTPVKSERSTELPLKCQQWMNELWKKLKAKSEARDEHMNTIRHKILGKRTDRIQSKLREKLATKKCSLAKLLENRPRLNKRTRALQEKAIKARQNALPTIREDPTINPELPKMPRLSEKRKLASWVKKSLPIYGTFIASDLVDASIKRRMKKIRQSLWSYRKAGKGSGMDIAKGNRPDRSDLQCLSTEVAVMMEISSRITRYTQMLDESIIGASFRPRLVKIIGSLKSYQEGNFVIGRDVTILNRFEKEVQDHQKTREQGESLLAYASGPSET